MRHLLFTFALLSAPLSAVADIPAGAPEAGPPGAACEAAHHALPGEGILDLLDPAAAGPARSAALEAYERLSTLPGCPEFGYTLGQMYRHGEELPGNLVARDIERARGLLLAMAEDGYLDAYADLAEMEMRHGEPRKAMQWTQVYLHFSRRVVWPEIDDPSRMRYQRSAYHGHLLMRATSVWRWPQPTMPKRLIREDLDAYLDVHGARVEARMRERQGGALRRASTLDGDIGRVQAQAGECYVDGGRAGAGAATWIVEILPDGRRGRVLLENFLPTVATAGAMGECLDRYTYTAAPGTGATVVRIPMVFGSTAGATLRQRR